MFIYPRHEKVYYYECIMDINFGDVNEQTLKIKKSKVCSGTVLLILWTKADSRDIKLNLYALCLHFDISNFTYGW